MLVNSFRTLLFTVLVAISGIAAAIPYELFDYAYNIDDAVASPFFGDPVPAEVDETMFDTLTGLGEINIEITGVGSHYVGLFVDHALETDSTNFFDESGLEVGVPASGQSWEIDEPGFLFGDIFTNFTASALDNSNAVPAGLEDDMSMALAWDFVLADGETAIIDFILSNSLGTSGFHLVQTDFFTETELYFWSALAVEGGTPQPPGGSAPEPGVFALLGIGFVALGVVRRRQGQLIVNP